MVRPSVNLKWKEKGMRVTRLELGLGLEKGALCA